MYARAGWCTSKLMRSSFWKARSATTAEAPSVFEEGGGGDGEAVAVVLMNTTRFKNPTKHKRKVFVTS